LSHLDLNTAAATGSLVVSAETREDPADQAHRHRQEAADARFERWKDGTRLGLSGLLVASITVFALYLSMAPASSADERTWGRTMLAGLVSAVGGYFIGKKS
jgi:hypothetical protein